MSGEERARAREAQRIRDARPCRECGITNAHRLSCSRRDNPFPEPATTWAYYVCRTRTDHGDVFDIREVYITDGREDRPSWTKDPIGPHGDTWLECIESLHTMTRDALGRRVLDITDESDPVWLDRTP